MMADVCSIPDYHRVSPFDVHRVALHSHHFLLTSNVNLRVDAIAVRYLRHLERVTSLVLSDCDGRYLTNRIVNYQRCFLPDCVPCHLIHLPQL